MKSSLNSNLVELMSRTLFFHRLIGTVVPFAQAKAENAGSEFGLGGRLMK